MEILQRIENSEIKQSLVVGIETAVLKRCTFGELDSGVF